MNYMAILIFSAFICSYALIGFFTVFIGSYISKKAKDTGVMNKMDFIILGEEDERDALGVFLLWPLVLMAFIFEVSNYYNGLLWKKISILKDSINLENIANYLPKLAFRLGKKLGDRK